MSATSGEGRRRIWCEALPPEILAEPATRALLVRYRLEPLVAVPPQAQTSALRAALEALTSDGIPWGVWPLLGDDDGYWLSTHNAARFVARVREVLRFVPGTPRTVAIDLEPPLALTRALTREPSLPLLWSAVRGALGPAEAAARADARAMLSTLLEALRAEGLETLAAVLPPVLLDLGARHRPIQAVLSTPLAPEHAAVVCPMLYSSMITPLIPGSPARATDRLLHHATRRLVAQRGVSGASIGLGVVGPGKLGDEPAYRSAADLAHDVALVCAAGATDLALFSLEAVLARAPETWLDALRSR